MKHIAFVARVCPKAQDGTLLQSRIDLFDHIMPAVVRPVAASLGKRVRCVELLDVVRPLYYGDVQPSRDMPA